MSVFETLRELEDDDLWFPEMEHGNSDLRIEATSYLKGTAIDEMIRKKLSGIYVLENMRCKSSQDMPPLPFNCEEEFERWKKIPRHTYYTFLYDIAKVKPSDEVPDKHVGETPWVPVNFDADNLALLNEAGQEDCPDCKDGFYYPFVGPREPCQTCQGKKPTADPCFADFNTEVFNRLSGWKIPGVTISRATRNRDNVHTFECRFTDERLKGLAPSPDLFAEDFCDGMKAELINHIGSCTNMKLLFDYSTLIIEYNPSTCCTNMLMELYLELL